MFAYYHQPLPACTVNAPEIVSTYEETPLSSATIPMTRAPAAARPLPTLNKATAGKRTSSTGSRSAQPRRGAKSTKHKKHAKRHTRAQKRATRRSAV
jgi:hypothetical protein